MTRATTEKPWRPVLVLMNILALMSRSARGKEIIIGRFDQISSNWVNVNGSDDFGKFSLTIAELTIFDDYSTAIYN